MPPPTMTTSARSTPDRTRCYDRSGGTAAGATRTIASIAPIIELQTLVAARVGTDAMVGGSIHACGPHDEES
jgi:hypothetical protein